MDERKSPYIKDPIPKDWKSAGMTDRERKLAPYLQNGVDNTRDFRIAKDQAVSHLWLAEVKESVAYVLDGVGRLLDGYKELRRAFDAELKKPNVAKGDPLLATEVDGAPALVLPDGSVLIGKSAPVPGSGSGLPCPIGAYRGVWSPGVAVTRGDVWLVNSAAYLIVSSGKHEELGDSAVPLAPELIGGVLAGGSSGGGTSVKELPDYPSSNGAGQPLVIGADGASVAWEEGIHLNGGPAPDVTLSNGSGEAHLYLHADGAAGVQVKHGSAAARTLIGVTAAGAVSLEGGRITINSGGTVELQVPPAGAAKDREVVTAAWVRARSGEAVKPVSDDVAALTAEVATLKATVATLQASIAGLVANGGGAKALRVLTQAEFDAITTKPDDTLFIIKG